ncbi:MAG TPA: hypothetical protein VFQ51_18970 [Vicinamibacteria bacterium]|nr:hypothetical protein [Vicinamibacteria bacterium]
MRTSWMVLVGLTLMAAPLVAQEPEQPAPEQEQEEARPEPALRIRVLQNPYDIAGFYRSGGGNPFYNGEGVSERSGNAYRDPYSIASYYRSSQHGAGYGYSQFWSSGYSGRDYGRRYRRRIGENGDLFFFAPAILAPVGPLSEVFLGGR